MIPITVAKVLEASATITTGYQLSAVRVLEGGGVIFLTQVPKAYACAASYLRRPGSRPRLLSQMLLCNVIWDLDLVSGPRF